MNESSVKAKMQQSIDALLTEIASVRTGRATSAMVESIPVKAYGGAQILKIMELASITVPDIGLIVIDPWDKSVIGEIKQGILAANVGINPSIDGEKIRIVVPPMTTEDREKYVKILHIKLENGKVAIRQIRGDAMHEIKKAFEDKTITEDDKFGQEKSLQTLTDSFITKIEELGQKKEVELRQI
jgi:ribosome recycling factor